MGQFLGFGAGQEGAIPAAGGVVNTYATVTATAGTKTVTTNLSVSVGDWVLLHQTQGGTNTGHYELVRVDSVSAGSFGVATNLDNSYTTGAQAIKVPRYNGGTLTGTLTGNAWDGSTGGIVTFAYSGKYAPTGSINVDGLGFRGGNSISGQNVGQQGEGTAGVYGTQSVNANGNGGGGGGYSTNYPWNQGNAGGGGGNGGVGANGRGTGGGQNQGGPGGTGGNAVGTTDGSVANLGGGGGSGGVGSGDSGSSGAGGRGAGLVILFLFNCDFTNGTISADGNVGGGCVYPLGGGGGGAGGHIVIYTMGGVFGTNQLHANGAVGGCVDNNCKDRLDGRGGPGGGGRITIIDCSATGSYQANGNDYSSFGGADNSPASNAGTLETDSGGHSFCGSLASVIE